MDKKKSIFLKVLLVIGFLIFFYPNISDYVNSFSQTRAIVTYDKAVGEYDKLDVGKIRSEACAYNQEISKEKDAIYKPDLLPAYEEKLNPFNDGMMGYINIEKIGLSLPVYHGVSEGVIQSAVGHLQGTSLPLGGRSTHAVLSSHCGLPSSKLFTDLNKLEIGDVFILSILGEDLYYRVCKIRTVLPNNVEDLKVVEGEDYVTLFTCTPYGINTHRLLVRGERIDPVEKANNLEVKDKLKKNIFISLVKFILLACLIIITILSIVKDLIKIAREKSLKED